MNIPEFIPERLKEARHLLGYSQGDLAKAVQMQQKDISLHENKTTKTLIPVRYLLFLHSQGIDLNSLFDEGMEVRLRTEEPHAAAPKKGSLSAEELAGVRALLKAAQKRAAPPERKAGQR